MDIVVTNGGSSSVNQALVLPKDLMNMLLDIGVDMRNIIEAGQSASRSHEQTLQVMQRIDDFINPQASGSKKPKAVDKANEDGDDWSTESFDKIKWFFKDNRESFIEKAKEASQWRSLI